MQTLSTIKDLLARRGIRPKHRFGQNFLHDHNQLRKLIDVAAISPGDLVLEIGPGTGTLTSALLEADASVVGCEIDNDMAAILHDEVLAHLENQCAYVIVGDCLASKHQLNPKLLASLRGDFKLIANLPYQITSPLIATILIRHWGEADTPRCRGMFVTVQREAADRLLAAPGTKDYGPLAILMAAFTHAERIAQLPPSCFWPAPRVNSSMIAITPEDSAPGIERAAFAEFLARGFQTRRKQLRAAFRDLENWPEGIDPTKRPEQFDPAEWVTLFEFVAGRA